MLWRINFNNFTNETVIPQYFEYRYGVDSEECIQTLIDLGYIEICTAKESLDILNITYLKKLLEQNNLSKTGKKDILLNRITDHISEETLAEQFSLRRYRATPSGEEILAKYDHVIQKHGPKM